MSQIQCGKLQLDNILEMSPKVELRLAPEADDDLRGGGRVQAEQKLERPRRKR
jgi:hypothetical protein